MSGKARNEDLPGAEMAPVRAGVAQSRTPQRLAWHGGWQIEHLRRVRTGIVLPTHPSPKLRPRRRLDQQAHFEDLYRCGRGAK